MRKTIFSAFAGVATLLATAAPAAAQVGYDYNDVVATGTYSTLWVIPTLIWCCAIIVGLGIQIAIMMWVYRDAKKNGVNNPELWLIICFISGLIGLVIYFFVVRQDAIAAKAAHGGHHSSEKKED
jgi:hypothetical protein